MAKPISEQREALLRMMVGANIPRLWCPTLTHYTGGGLDTARQAAHWRWMCPHVGGFLVPGSTGEGWEMSEAEIAELLNVSFDLCARLEGHLLVGVLRTDVAAMQAVIANTLATLRARTGEKDDLLAMRRARVCAFTICPPQGAELTQPEIKAGLEAVLEMHVPVAIYQLPQVTQNEMSPALVADLIANYPNFIMLKDTSGTDRVPLALGAEGREGIGRQGVYLVRGAEGGYAGWLEEFGGPYQGLLLSTANSFPAHLDAVLALAEAGREEEAEALSTQLTQVVEAVFAVVSDLPDGNPFANANKAIDHFMAHGPGAVEITPPLLHSGVYLPTAVIARTGELLEEAELMPNKGYL